MDKAQLLVLTRQPDLLRAIEVIGLLSYRYGSRALAKIYQARRKNGLFHRLLCACAVSGFQPAGFNRTFPYSRFIMNFTLLTTSSFSQSF
jgi:hypothetical protein